MLPNLQQFLSLLVCGIQLWGAALTYWLPLRHSPHFWQRALLCLIPSIPLSTFLLWVDYTPSSLFLRAGAYILFCMWMIFASHSCTQLDWSGANYCAIWGILSALTTFELWQLLVWCLAQVNIFLPLDQPSALLLQLLFFAAAYCLLRVTVAHSMPYEGSYHIGPRQQISAIILGGMFVLLFLTMQTVTNSGVSQETSIFIVVPLALCQLYCITLLYLQTELFKKAAMEKEMNSLNMLYERQRQQYQVAKRNVQIINRKCHELKVQTSGDAQAVENARHALELVLRSEAKDIREKYVEPPYTTTFGILFLPFEGLYAEVVNAGLLEVLQRDYQVNIAGPSTMAALLNSLQMGFKTLAIQKRSGEVWQLLGAVKTEFDKFGQGLSKLQQRLRQTDEELDNLIGVRSRAISRKLRAVQTMDDASAAALLELDTEPGRPVSARLPESRGDE